jgi:hypothetical protein
MSRFPPAIFFRARHYDPGTTPGRRLLAHELAHVVQQEAGPRTAQRYRLAPAGDPGERVADRAAEDIVLRGRAQPMAVPPQVPLIQRKAFIGHDPLLARPAEFGDSPPRKSRGPRPARKERNEPGVREVTRGLRRTFTPVSRPLKRNIS